MEKCSTPIQPVNKSWCSGLRRVAIDTRRQAAPLSCAALPAAPTVGRPAHERPTAASPEEARCHPGRGAGAAVRADPHPQHLHRPGLQAAVPARRRNGAPASCSDIGFEARWCRPPGIPWWWAHARAPRRTAAPHVLFYGHYDVQPPDPLELWKIAAVRAAHRHRQGQRQGDRGARRRGQQGPAHDLLRGGAGLEERGRRAARSPSPCCSRARRNAARRRCRAFLAKHGKEVTADLALVCDTGQWDKDTPAISTQLRGPRRHRARHHRPEPRPAFGQLRRRGHEPHPRAGQDPGRDARRQRQGAHPRLLRRHQEALGQAARAVGGPRLRRAASSWATWA